VYRTIQYVKPIPPQLKPEASKKTETKNEKATRNQIVDSGRVTEGGGICERHITEPQLASEDINRTSYTRRHLAPTITSRNDDSIQYACINSQT